MKVIIGSVNSEHIALDIDNRGHSETDDYLDGNWINTLVEFQLGAFKGQYACYLNSPDFTMFYSQLSELSEKLIGSAVFRTTEQQVEIILAGDGKGHVDVTGFLQDVVGTGNTLEYSFQIDQTFLPAILRDIRSIVDKFPVGSNAK